jgi:NADH-quinone oxidoreductase subunit N
MLEQATDAVFSGPSVDWWALTPLLVLVGGGTILLVVAALTPVWRRGWYAIAAALIAGIAVAAAGVLWADVSADGPRMLVGRALALDHLALLATIAIGVSIVLASFVSDDFLRREVDDGPEVYALYLMAGAGGVVMASANDLIVLFLGIETLSIAMYVLAASHRRRVESQEAGLKYFVLGGFSSAFLLYGIALVYGATGSTNLTGIADTLAGEVTVTSGGDALLLAGLGLMLVGLAFKVSAVPFHVWSPDVYQGAPTPVTSFLASTGKIAAFAALLRVLLVGFPARYDDWRPVIWVLAVLTLLVGSVVAVVQTDVKRMLAYSSVSHAGFILVGVEAAGHIGAPGADRGSAGVMAYTFIYAVLVIGTFAVVTVVARSGDRSTDLSSFRGLSREKPLLAAGLTVLLIAQAGVPLTSGFVAKFGVIQAAVEVRSYAIALIAMLAAVVAAFLYLRIMVSVWLEDPEAGDGEREALRVPLGLGFALTLAVGFTLVVGFFPSWLIEMSRDVSELVLR